jgi:putative selenate reductase
VAIPGSTFRIEADTIVVAVGQAPDVAFLADSGIILGGGGRVVVHPGSGKAGERAVYAGGDAVRGPATIVEACADARCAAAAICAELGIAFQAPEAVRPPVDVEAMAAIARNRARRAGREGPALAPVSERGMGVLVEQALTVAGARREASRCLQCTSVCDKCVEVCPNRANQGYAVTPGQWDVPRLACKEGVLVISGFATAEVRQDRQIVHIADLCNECGNCATFCVHPGRPYADKPRLFLRRAEFDAQDDNAFYVSGEEIWGIAGGETARVTVRGGGLVYEDRHVRAHLDERLQPLELVLLKPFAGSVSLRRALDMGLLLRGIRQTLPWLAEQSGALLGSERVEGDSRRRRDRQDD